MKKFTNFLAGAILGGIFGSLIVLLLTPSSGEELRAELQEKIKNIQLEIQKAAKERRHELEQELKNLRQATASKPDLNA